MTDPLKQLIRRIGRTYRAHLEMAKRLQRRDRNWNFALICLSANSTIAAVALLSEPNLYGNRGPTLWALMGVMTLAISLVIANADYKSRSESAFRDYRDLQRLWSKAHNDDAGARRAAVRTSILRNTDLAYQRLLDRMPNHSAADFYNAVRLFGPTSCGFDDSNDVHLQVRRAEFCRVILLKIATWLLTEFPIILALLSFIALIPIVAWLAA